MRAVVSRSAAFSPDGRRIVTARSTKPHLYGMPKSGHALVYLFGNPDRFTFDMVSSVAFSPDGTRIVAASESIAWVWGAKSRFGGVLLVLDHNGSVTGAAFSPDGTRIVTASQDKTARIWDAQSGQVLLALQGHNGGIMSAAFSPDSTRIVTASEDKQLGYGTPEAANCCHSRRP